jgi:hypothetical protein
MLVFWGADPVAIPAFLPQLRAAMPDVSLVGCSTAGEIESLGVREGSVVLTAVHFDASTFSVVETDIGGVEDSAHAGRRLGAQLPRDGLRGVMLFAPGVDINGAAMLEAMAEGLPDGIPISGGLAADNGAFKLTCVLGPSGCSTTKLVAIGFYGDQLQFGAGCRGGWSAFGPTRKITRAEGSRLYELDGQPALALYKNYLGSYASELPAAGLLFPLEMLDDQKKSIGLLRTILGIDEATQSLILAGTVAQGAYLRLMHATTDALVDGAERAAQKCASTTSAKSGLALLVSCVGRRIVMRDRVDEEVIAVAEQLGTGFTLAGFYSNGEISPLYGLSDCKLHNQTMTIALLSESCTDASAA